MRIKKIDDEKIFLKERIFPLRTVFWGYHNTGFQTYNYLKKSKLFNLIAVVLPDDRIHETILKIKYDAGKSGISIFEPRILKSNTFIKNIKNLSPDIYVVDSYSKLIPAELLKIPTIAGFNLHPGLLPKYRGAHVLNWALINGDKEIAITLHLLTKNFDEGPIVCFKKVDIDPLDTICDIDKKVTQQVQSLLSTLEKKIKKGKIVARFQYGRSKHYPARKPEDGKIDMGSSAVNIYNKIRALSYPWPGAFIIKNAKKIVIWRALPLDLQLNVNPGALIEKEGDIYLVSADRKLLHIRCINDPSSKTYAPRNGIEISRILHKLNIKIIKL